MRAFTLALIIVSNLVVGVGNQIKIIYNIINPAEYIAQLDNKQVWFAYQVKAQEDTKSMCCWDKKGKNSQCDLDNNNYNYGSNSKDILTEHINIYVNVNSGHVKKIITVGEQCEVIANANEINWLADVTTEKSINWLKDVSFEKNNTTSNALHALALHKGKEASVALYEIAEMNNHINSENAVFWLGASRHDGVVHLDKLYNNLPTGDVKRHINFALSQSESPQAIKILLDIANNDKDNEQKADALFWLAHLNPIKAKEIVLETLKNNPSDDQINHAVFTLSQISQQTNDDALFKLLTGEYSKQVKTQALFWLSQSDNSKTIEKLQNLL